MSRSANHLLIAAVMTAGAACFPAFADTSGSAISHVRVAVNSNVGITPINPTIDAGTVQTGNFVASIDFKVDANTEAVCFTAFASPLYKGNDPTNTTVAPIPLNLQAGILVQPVNANPTLGHANVLAFVAESSDTIQGFPVFGTETVQYESSQNNHFSQTVNMKVTWTQTDPELPTGEYSGIVQLSALVFPN